MLSLLAAPISQGELLCWYEGYDLFKGETNSYIFLYYIVKPCDILLMVSLLPLRQDFSNSQVQMRRHEYLKMCSLCKKTKIDCLIGLAVRDE